MSELRRSVARLISMGSSGASVGGPDRMHGDHVPDVTIYSARHHRTAGPRAANPTGSETSHCFECGGTGRETVPFMGTLEASWEYIRGSPVLFPQRRVSSHGATVC